MSLHCRVEYNLYVTRFTYKFSGVFLEQKFLRLPSAKFLSGSCGFIYLQYIHCIPRGVQVFKRTPNSERIIYL